MAESFFFAFIKIIYTFAATNKETDMIEGVHIQRFDKPQTLRERIRKIAPDHAILVSLNDFAEASLRTTAHEAGKDIGGKFSVILDRRNNQAIIKRRA